MQFWRLIYSGAGPAYWNMAVDEMLFLRCQEKKNFPPTLRIYDWSKPAVSIGYFQDINLALNVQKAQQEGLKVVRRITGGRAVLHYGELTYAVVANSTSNPELGLSLMETYREISMALSRALAWLGIRAEYKKGQGAGGPSRLSYHSPCFESAYSYELTVNGQKLLGSAQRRRQEFFIQQGSMPREKRELKLQNYLVAENGEVSGLHSWDEKAICINSLVGKEVDLLELKECLKSGFQEHFGMAFIEEGLTKPELNLAFKLEREKYSQEYWNFRPRAGLRPGRRIDRREQPAFSRA